MQTLHEAIVTHGALGSLNTDQSSQFEDRVQIDIKLEK